MNSSKEVPIPIEDWAREAGKVDQVRDLLQTILQKKQKTRRKLRRGLVSLLVLGAFSLWAIPAYRDTGTLSTASAHRGSFTLQDGSKAELNARTLLKTDFRYGRRVIELSEGEAFFSVKTDAAHPFLVKTPSGTVHVIGTQFDVRLGSHGTEVTLIDGEIRYDQPRTSVLLRPGEQVADDSSQRALTAKEVTSVLSWRTGTLSMDGLTLAEAAERMAAYHGRTIHVSPQLDQLRIGGSCPLGDLPEFLSFLQEAFPVSLRTNPDGSLDLLPR